MNELFYVYLDFNPYADEEEGRKIDELIERMDELLLTVGMKYAGFDNVYVAVDRKKRDQVFYQAEKILKNTEWLKGIFSYSSIGTWMNACPISEIRTDGMSDPSPEKMRYYEEYYKKTKCFPHAIVVDEDKKLRDGYISYLLSGKYNKRAYVCESVSDQPLRKAVRGRHVRFADGAWHKKSIKRYIWIYTLREPVVPGDILLVNTETGKDFMCVDTIEYISGHEFCVQYKKVRKHMNMRMDERQDTDHEK